MGDHLGGRQLCNMECRLKWRQGREYFWPARWQRAALINLRMCCLENPSSCVAHMVSLKSATTGIYGPLDLLKKMPLNLRPFQAVLLLPYSPGSPWQPFLSFCWFVWLSFFPMVPGSGYKAFRTRSDSILVPCLGQQHWAGSNSRWLAFKGSLLLLSSPSFPF